MPLLFESLSHGEVPFGFFNIETDMILLNDYFFFASDVSERIIEIAGEGSRKIFETEWDAYILEIRQIGNLMGAISGVELSGFIGEVYGHFPFPHEPDKFKQNPNGYINRELVEGVVRRYTAISKIQVVVDAVNQTIRIGEYLFSKQGFHELLKYLWLGGYPRWKDGIRPEYIVRMKERIEHSTHPFFEGAAANMQD
jgi:hypothetical protein